MALILAVLALPTAAQAHRKNVIVKGYVSNVSAVLPNVLGLTANVLGGDARLRVSNYSGKTVVVLGYQGEPYLRFTKAGVFVNDRSPAAFLNRTRRPGGLRPGLADPRARPSWRRVAVGASYAWFDHRIHWTESTEPPGVQRHPALIQRVFSWRVPGRADGRPFVISGILGYSPRVVSVGGGDSPWVVAASIGGGVVLAAAALVGAEARRRKRRASS